MQLQANAGHLDRLLGAVPFDQRGPFAHPLTRLGDLALQLGASLFAQRLVVL